MPAYSWGFEQTVAPATQAASVGLQTDYGKDITTWQSADQTEPDLDPTFTQIDGLPTVAQACARRLCMRHGALPENPDAGFDLRRFLNGKWSRAKAFSVKTGVERECAKDERVYTAAARVSYVPRTRSLLVEADLYSMFGRFQLVLAVDDVSVTLLRSSV